MGRSPCCDHENANVKKGPWTPEEDNKLKEYIEKNGCGNWRNLPKKAGLNRCGKSCRLRWTNYLRPDILRGGFSMEEEKLIVHLHSVLGNKWSAIAARLPGRTDNEIKNYWNTHLRKKLLMMGIDPVTHRPRVDQNLNLLSSLPNLIAATNLSNLATNPLLSNAIQLHRLQLLQTLLQAIANSSTTSTQNMNAPLGMQDLNQLALSSLGSDNTFQGCMPSNIVTIDGNGGYLDAPILINGSCASELDSTPSLVAASSENCSVDEARDQANLSGSSSPNSTPFELSGGLNVDDLDIDLDWKDILNQLSWSEELQRKTYGHVDEEAFVDV